MSDFFRTFVPVLTSARNMKYPRILTLLAIVSAFFAPLTSAKAANPQIALKTNLVWAATATPNIGMEVGLARKWTLQAAYGINAWSAIGQEARMRHWLVVPEVRYWPCNRFVGHFVGLQTLGGQFNAGAYQIPLYKWNDLRDYRLEGWMIGAGLLYGYQVPMSEHWNFEAAIGVGYVYFDYDRYPCAECGTVQGRGNWHYVGLTKLGVSFMYLF